VQQHQLDRVADRGQSGAVTGSEPAADLFQEPVVIGENDVFLRPVAPEEGRTAKPGALGDVIHGRLLVTVLVEQVERGLREPVTRRWLAHDRPSSLVRPTVATCETP
jgi:hypothetical protein